LKFLRFFETSRGAGGIRLRVRLIYLRPVNLIWVMPAQEGMPEVEGIFSLLDTLTHFLQEFLCYLKISLWTLLIY
jgi:hypothetical protein